MGNGPSEIVVLRPTKVFLAFLASQLPKHNIPSMSSLQVDNTAYIIKKCDTQQGTLDEIERLSPKMFRHELCRWLGSDAHNPIVDSMMDFLCCFKLEFHTHLILLEPSLQEAHQALQLKPQIKMLHWLNSVVDEDDFLDEIMEQVTLSHLVENSTLLIKNFNTLGEIKPYLKRYYKPLFETAMSRMSNKPQQWPKIHTFEEFSHHFKVEIHTQLISYLS